MKLTRAQRLFMKAGFVDCRLRAYAACFRTLHPNSLAYPLTAQEARILRRERKRAIRAALEEWRKEGYMPVDEERPQGVVKNEPAAHGEEPANPVVKNAPGRVEKGEEQ